MYVSPRWLMVMQISGLHLLRWRAFPYQPVKRLVERHVKGHDLLRPALPGRFRLSNTLGVSVLKIIVFVRDHPQHTDIAGSNGQARQLALFIRLDKIDQPGYLILPVAIDGPQPNLNGSARNIPPANRRVPGLTMRQQPAKGRRVIADPNGSFVLPNIDHCFRNDPAGLVKFRQPCSGRPPLARS